MVPIIAALAEAGLSLIGNAILTKGKDVVEEKLGVKIPDDPKALTPELTKTLAMAQMQHEEFLISAALEEKKIELDNTKDARVMQIAALQQGDQFAKHFVYYFMTAWSGFAIVYIALITFVEIPQRNMRFVDTVLGFVLGTIVAAMFNFLLGSSTGSVKAQQMMRDMVEKGKGVLK